MTKRNYRKKQTKKKQYKKKHRFTMVQGIRSKTFLQNHRYSTGITLDSGVNTLAGHVFSANGIFDCDVDTAGIHSAILFDEMTALYNHFTVLASKITVTFFSPTDTSASVPNFCAIGTFSGTAKETDIDVVMQNGRSRWKYITQGNGSNSMTTIVKQNNISAFLGQNVIQEDNNAGSASGNPSEQVYYHVYSGSIDSNDGPIIKANVVIDYKVVWHEPKSIGIS